MPPASQALMLANAGREHATAAMAVTSSTVYLGAAAGGLLVGAAPGVIPLFSAGCAFVAIRVTNRAQR